jgi:serine protease Do
MKRNRLLIALVIAALVVTGCGAALGNSSTPAPTQVPAAAVQPASVSYSPAAPAKAPVAAALSVDPALTAFENAFETIYQNVSPSVVLIDVTTAQGGGLGSGFVWDTQGHIVTNNHVVDGANSITVVFSDQSTATATVVGTDPASDLAVIKVDVPASKLRPVTLGDSTTVKVGQIAVAIGNPFGEANTMTTGIISAVARSLPTDLNAVGPTYTIPDILQTDAPINPGNSGGVLLNAAGQVIGVTSAIESPSQSSAGIGFAIPAEVVQSVVPVLIQTGKFDHAWLGISGTSLTPDLATAMGLPNTQAGALVATVTAGGPAADAGLQGSNTNVTIHGMQTQVGGDVITAINGQPMQTFNDVVAYLAVSTRPGQKVNLTILRGGKEMTVSVTLGTRPAATTASSSSSQINPFGSSPFGNTPNGNSPFGSNPFGGTPNQTQPSSGAYLGINGLTMDSTLADAMNLPSNQTGVLVAQVQAGTPAASAGLLGGTDSILDNGQNVPVGGDVIIGFGRQRVTSLQDLQSLLAQAQPGQRVTLTVLRNGRQMSVSVTLGQSTMSTQ